MRFHYVFASLIGIDGGTASSATGLKICLKTIRIKKNNARINKERNP